MRNIRTFRPKNTTLSKSLIEFNDSRLKWREIRTRYCTLKLLVSGAKSESEILELLGTVKEFFGGLDVKLTQDESANILIKVIKDLVNEGKIKRRDIYNTRTKESRAEWFVNPDWISRTRILKSEILRIRNLEEQENQLKAELERIKFEKEEGDKRQHEERLRIERAAKQTTANSLFDQKISTAATSKTQANPPVDKKSSDSQIIAGILSIIAVGGGLYIISKIGNALNKALTFPVFLVACVTVYCIYYLTKNKP
jgi:hypothetical protein